MNSKTEYVKNQVKDTTPKSIIDAISTQLDRLEDAKRRIEEEGIVVRDLKGAVVAHPAIKIEQDATKIVADLLMKHKKVKSAFNL
jgi:hypothetical protein